MLRAVRPLLESDFGISVPRNLRDSARRRLHLPSNDSRPRPTVFEPLQGGTNCDVVYHDWYQFLDLRYLLLRLGRNLIDTDEMVMAGLILWKIRQDQRAAKGNSTTTSTLDESSVTIDTSVLQHAEKYIVESGMLYTIIATATALAYIVNNNIYSPLSCVVCDYSRIQR